MEIKRIQGPKGWRPRDCYMICDLCNRKIRHSEHQMTWDGFVACKYDWYPKHDALEKIPVVTRESHPIKNARPEGEDQYIVNGSVDGSTL